MIPKKYDCNYRWKNEVQSIMNIKFEYFHKQKKDLSNITSLYMGI